MESSFFGAGREELGGKLRASRRRKSLPRPHYHLPSFSCKIVIYLRMKEKERSKVGAKREGWGILLERSLCGSLANTESGEMKGF